MFFVLGLLICECRKGGLLCLCMSAHADKLQLIIFGVKSIAVSLMITNCLL
jgi:hypothetical protein